MRNYMQIAALLISVTSFIAAHTATAEVVLDQHNDLTGFAAADSVSGGFTENAQTFTVGVTGTLNRIEVQAVRFFGTEGNLIVSVYNTVGDTDETKLPTGGSLGSQSMPFGSIPTTGYEYQVFDFSALPIPIPLTAGTVMAFGVGSTPNSAGGGLRSSFNVSTYAGGRAVFRQANPSGSWQNFFASHDYGFKIYVDVTEPAATPGDFNDDGTVDAADYPLWRKFLNNPSEAALNGNGDGSNGIDLGDYNLWRENFAEGGGGAAAAHVPEPGAHLICIAACVSAVSAYRRRRQ